jgi:EAL domain-containing protein (putative c-di-GMP-specific phosphodiesterase class I)
MAESLDLTLVAEGVENAETLAALREMGAAQAQGYYFAEPMPLEELLLTTLASRLQVLTQEP